MGKPMTALDVAKYIFELIINHPKAASSIFLVICHLVARWGREGTASASRAFWWCFDTLVAFRYGQGGNIQGQAQGQAQVVNQYFPAAPFAQLAAAAAARAAVPPAPVFINPPARCTGIWNNGRQCIANTVERNANGEPRCDRHQ